MSELRKAYRQLKGEWFTVIGRDCVLKCIMSTNENDYTHFIEGFYYTGVEAHFSRKHFEFIGTKEEFENCSREKWHLWKGEDFKEEVEGLIVRIGDVVLHVDEWEFCDIDADDMKIIAYTKGELV